MFHAQRLRSLGDCCHARSSGRKGAQRGAVTINRNPSSQERALASAKAAAAGFAAGAGRGRAPQGGIEERLTRAVRESLKVRNDDSEPSPTDERAVRP